ncbi:MAG: response regulator [Nitrososphaeraceae archaeon]
MSSTFNLTNIPFNEHVMVLYNNDDDYNNAATNLINDGLKNGFHCIYASVSAHDSKSSSNISNLSSNIDNYKENIERDELRIVDFKPYYESALNLDFRPFKKLKKELEETLNQRKSEGKKDAILVFADAACFLSHNKRFKECEILEWWWNETTTEWRENNQNITVICPHPGQILNDPLLSETIRRIGSMHTITIDFNCYMDNKKHYNYDLQKISKSQEYKNKKKKRKILIVEPEPDIQYIYSLFTRQHGFRESDVNILENGNECLEIVFSKTATVDHNNDDNEYDIIILDSHLPDISGFEVARKIRDRFPHIRIILTTTYSLDNICDIIDSIGIKNQDVFVKPFNFDKLISVIEEER